MIHVPVQRSQGVANATCACAQVKAVAAYIQRRASEDGQRLQYETARAVAVRGVGMGDRCERCVLYIKSSCAGHPTSVVRLKLGVPARGHVSTHLLASCACTDHAMVASLLTCAVKVALITVQ